MGKAEQSAAADTALRFNLAGTCLELCHFLVLGSAGRLCVGLHMRAGTSVASSLAKGGVCFTT